MFLIVKQISKRIECREGKKLQSFELSNLLKVLCNKKKTLPIEAFPTLKKEVYTIFDKSQQYYLQNKGQLNQVIYFLNSAHRYQFPISFEYGQYVTYMIRKFLQIDLDSRYSRTEISATDHYRLVATCIFYKEHISNDILSGLVNAFFEKVLETER